VDGRGLTGRLIPTIGDVLFVSILFKTLSLGRQLLNDGDTGWHIATGMHILGTMSIPRHDIFSHTAQNIPWVAHEWLSEVVYALVYRAVGMNGVVVLTAVVLGLVFFSLYKYLLKCGVGPLVAAPFTVLAVLASSGHWLARPHVFSMGLTLYFYSVLEDYRESRANRLWSLPLVMILWANLHAGFFLGIVFICVYAFSEFAASVFSPRGSKSGFARAKTLGFTAAATLLASFANPRGPALLLFPFHLAGREFVMDNVQEWASTNFHTEKLFELALIVSLSVIVLASKKLRLHEVIILLLITRMSLASARFIELFSVVVIPMAAIRFEGVAGRLTGAVRPGWLKDRFFASIAAMSSRASALEGQPRLHVWVYASIAACLFITVNGGAAFGARLMDYRFDPAKFPVRAVDFAANNGITGNMFNQDGWGGYVIYRQIPGYRVFMDGRFDMYSVDLLKEYLDAAKGRLDYQTVLDKYGVDWVMFNTGSTLCMLLDSDKSWRLVYSDGTADIFLRDTPGNSALIEKYGVERSPYKPHYKVSQDG
jgi:hypothetical protein